MAETKIIKKYFWAWNFDNEEAWLNDMAKEGWALTGVSGISYQFEKTEPGEYTYLLDYHKEDVPYLKMLDDAQVERVAYNLSWNYLRKRTSEGKITILSDANTKADRLSVLGKMLLYLGIINIIVGIVCCFYYPAVCVLNLLVAVFVFYGFGCIKTKRDLYAQGRIK